MSTALTTTNSPVASADHRLEEIKALARDHAEDAIATLAEVMNDKKAPAPARVVSSNSLLNRGFGMPERRTETKVDVTIFDQRQAHLQALQKLAIKNQTVNIVEDAEFTIVDAPKAKEKAHAENATTEWD